MDVNYDTMELDALLEARQSIDSDAQPELAAKLDQLIAAKQHSESDSPVNSAPTQAEENTQLTYRQPQQVELSFSGKRMEYFKIWIVNTLLTIVTLGVFSAWAKVRNNQYLYSKLSIDGHSFRYLAKPMNILKGRMIAVVLMVIYFSLSHFYPLKAPLFMLGLMLFMPMLIRMSLRFSMRMTSYRGVRFDFNGSVGETYKVYGSGLLLTILSLGFGFPYFLKMINQFIYSNVKWGNKSFQSELSASPFYIASILSGVIFMILGGLMSVILLAGEPTEPTLTSVLLPIIPILLYLVAIAVSQALFAVLVRNEIFENTHVPGLARFVSDIKVPGYMWITVTNILMTMATLGLAYPVTVIRKSQYIAENTHVSLTPDVDNVVQDILSEDSSMGEEVADMFDFDVTIG